MSKFFAVSEVDYRLLKLIINSQLMIDNDLTLVNYYIPGEPVQHNRFRSTCVAVTVIAAVNVTVILLNKSAVSNILKNLSIIPACLVSAGGAHHLGNLLYKNYRRQMLDKDLSIHVEFLQNFCKLVQVIIDGITETDMIRGSGLRSQPSGNHDHKSLVLTAKFRKTIVAALIVLNKNMSDGFVSLKEIVPKIVTTNIFPFTSVRKSLPDNTSFDDTSLSINDLNNMNHMFQVTQSEYLRWLALCFCSMHPQNEILIKNVCIKVIKSVHSVVAKYYCELNFLYAANVHERRSCDAFVENQSGTRYLDILADDVHTIILNHVELMEDIKSIKSSLSKWIMLVDEEKQSVEETLKLFAIEFNKFKIKLRNSNDYILQTDTNIKQQIIRSIIISKSQEMDPDKHIKEHQGGTPVSVNTVQVTSKQPVLEQKSDETASYVSPVPISGGYAAFFTPQECNIMAESSYSDFNNENVPGDVISSTMITNEAIFAPDAVVAVSVNKSNVTEFNTACNSQEYSFLSEDF